MNDPRTVSNTFSSPGIVGPGPELVYAPGIVTPSMCRLANPRRSGSLLPGLVLFVAVVWLVVACLQTATEMDWLGPGPRTNRELGIDARALFYTEIDLDTPKPVIGMMPDAPSSGREQ